MFDICSLFLTKTFLPQRTVTVVSRSCLKFTPFRVADKILFSDVLTFGNVEIDAHLPSISVGPFLTEVTNLATASICHKLLGDFEKNRATA